MIDDLQKMIYEHPEIIALGPEWSALLAGFAVVVWGELHITPAGERYLSQARDG